MSHKLHKDYLDLLVLIEEFKLPPELANENFETFEIQGRHSKIVIRYTNSLENYKKGTYLPLFNICKAHPLFIDSYGDGGGGEYRINFEFWLSLKHKEEDLLIHQQIRKVFRI